MTEKQSAPAARGLDARFVQRVLFVAAVGVLLVLAWWLSGIVLLAFGAIVVAVVLRSLADPIQRYGHLNDRWSFAAAVAIVLLLIVAVVAMFGTQLAMQMDTLLDAVSDAWTSLMERLRATAFGRRLMSGFDGEGGGTMVGGLVLEAGQAFFTATAAVLDIIVVVCVGCFLGAAPDRYRDGLLRLIPRRARGAVAEAIDESGFLVRRWLQAKLAVMVLVGILVGIGTSLLGLPSPLALALFAALTDFVPFIGPIIGAIPAVLLALGMDVELAIWTVLLYIAIQQLEGNLISPLLEQRILEIPAAVMILSVLVLGLLFGPLGVVVAGPLAVVMFVFTRRLYVEGILGEQIDRERTREP